MFQLYEGLREKLPAYARPIFVRLVNKIDVTGKHNTVITLYRMKIGDQGKIVHNNIKYFQPFVDKNQTLSATYKLKKRDLQSEGFNPELVRI